MLTDTAELHYQAWQRLANEEGLPFNRQANEALRGVSRRDSLLLILAERSYPEAALAEMMERKNRYYGELLQTLTPAALLPGAINLLEELRQVGIKIAIGSGSKNARTVIEKLGLRTWVDAIADGHSVERTKPAPDLFLCAAHLLGLKPHQCVVFEDAAAGIEAARAGGMKTVGIGPRERVGAADIVLADLQGVHWTDLATQLTCTPPE